MLLLIFLSTALSLNPIYIIPDFDQSPIYVKLTKPELYPECPSDINSSSLSDQNFITQNPKCVAKLLRVRFNTATQKVEQLDGIETYSSDIGVSSEIFTKLTALINKLKELRYQENVNLFAVGYNFYLHPVMSFTVFSELKKKIEEGSQNSAEKAIILSFGLGSSFSSIFLSNYSNSNWVKQYIEKVIFIAPLFAGSSTFSKLFNQVLEPFPDDDDIKKTISMMPGLQIMLPNYEVFRDKTVIYNLYTDFDQYNASHSFEFLKLQNKVDSESEKIFKSEIEKYLKAPIPEPPVQSFVIYNDAVNQPVSYVINRHKSNKVTTINDIKGDGIVSSEGAEYACTKWKSVKCFNIHNYTNHNDMLTRGETLQQIINSIQNNQNDIKKQAIFLASGFNGSPLYATVKDKTKAPSCPSNLNNYLFYSSFANNMYQRIDETNSSLWLSDKCIAHLTRVELNSGKTDVLYSNGITLQSSKIGDFNHLKGLELLITKMSNKGHVQYKNMFGVGYNYIHFPLLNGDKYLELKNNIEKYFTENGEKSILVGYDQGSLFVEYFLTEYVTTEWAKKYVSAAIFYAPIFGGTGAYNELVTGNIGNGFPNNNEEMNKSISRMPGLHIKMPNEVVFGEKIVIRDMIRDGYTFTSEYAPDLLINLGKMNETAKSIFDLTSKYRKQAPKEPPVPSLIVYNDYINTANGYTYKKNTNSVEAINEKGDGSISADGARYACNNWENAICFNHRNSQASHEQIPIHNATVDLTTTFIDQLHSSKSFPIKKTFTINTVLDNFANFNYVQSHRIGNDKFNYSANAGYSGGRKLSNVFDNLDNNYWVPNKPNTDDFKNAITVEFNKLFAIEAILIDTAYNSRSYDNKDVRIFVGFPKRINIYTSANDEDVELNSVFIGNPVHPWKRVQLYSPNPMICKKLKIEFDEITIQNLESPHDNRPAIADILFIEAYDIIEMKEVKPPYTSIEFSQLSSINKIVSYNANGNSKRRYPLSNLFSNDESIWISDKPNTNDFKNHIIITYSKEYEIFAILFDAVFTEEDQKYHGFPLLIKVYTSVNGSDFTLQSGFYGQPNKRVACEFNKQIICDKIKIEFVQLTDQTITDQSKPSNNPALKNLYIIKKIQQTPYTVISELYKNSDYVSAQTIDQSLFTRSCNGGSQENFPFENVFDNNNQTYWRSGTENTDEFKNTITIEFTETTQLDAFLYDSSFYTNNGVTPIQRNFDGFPKILNIYNSTGDSSELIAIFVGTPAYPMDRVQFVFPFPVICDKLKLEFYEITPLVQSGEMIPTIANLLFIKSNTIFGTYKGTEGKYQEANYIASHKILRNEFTATSNNGDNMNIAFDGSANNYWRPSRANDDDFKNSITLTFREVTEIEAFLYDTSYHTKGSSYREFDGFPTILHVYKSIEDDNFELAMIFEGNPVYPWTRIQFVFPEVISCKKLKFVFYKVTPDTVRSNKSQPVIADITLIRNPTPTETPTSTPIASPEPTPDPTPEPTPDQTPDPTPDPTPYPTEIPTPFPTETETPTESLTESFYATPTETLEQTPEPTPIPTMTPNETPTSTPSMTPNETPTSTPASTPIPTSSPSISPTSTPLATPSQSPTISPAPIENQCTDINHCEAEGSQSKPIILTILSSSFYNSSMQTNGGAVNVINAGVKCQGINFSNCTSNNGVGGGICINNNVDINADITLEHIQFSECKASSGSAVYIYSDSQISQITIRYCNFTSNNASSLNEKNQYKFGGSAIFIAARKGIISNCHFSNNKGNGGNLKIHNHFNGNGKIRYSSHLLGDVESDFLVSECDFQIEDSTPCSLYYYRGDRGSTFEVNNCIFSGTLNRNARYIDGTAISIDSPKMIVKSCTFYDTYEKSINRANNYLNLNPDDQKFIDPLEELNKNDKRKLSKTTWALIGSVIAVFCLILLLVTLLVFVIICGKRKIKEIEELKMDSKKLEKYQA